MGVSEAKQTNDFSKGSVMGNVARLAIPMTAAQLINVLYNIVDRIYIGRIGDGAAEALTGLGVCLPIISIVIAFANLVGMGGSSLFSIERGAGNTDEAAAIEGNSFVMLIIIGVALTFLGYVFKDKALYLLGASRATFVPADKYISIYLLGNMFVMLSLGLNSFINAQGFGKIGMLTVAIGAVINIVLDPIFIFVLNMGVSGAALATIISQFVSFCWTIKFLTGKKAVIRLERKFMRLKAERIKKITALGLSGFTMSITNSLVQIMYNANLQIYGGDVYVGVMTIINSVREVVQMPVQGFSQSAQPVMGFNYGAQKYDRVKKTIKYSSILLISYTLVAWALIFLFPRFFLGIFTSDESIISAGVLSLHIYFFGFFFMALQFSGQGVFTALGFAKKAIFFSIFRKVIIVIPLIYILPLMGLGTNGIFMSEPISNLIGGTACFLAMYFSVYRKLGKDGKNTEKF